MTRNAFFGGITVFSVVAALGVSSCAPKVLVPPRMDLKSWNTLGLVEFASSSNGNLQKYTTQKFLEEIQSAQPGVRVIELGPESQVLSAVGKSRLDPEAMKAIGEKYSVDAVFTGTLDVTGVKPKIDLALIVQSLSVEAEVEASLTTKLQEARSGATLWTNSAQGKQRVAGVSFFSGHFSFDAKDPDAAYGSLVRWLVSEVTVDFRARWERKRK